jgi:hypothetical protein
VGQEIWPRDKQTPEALAAQQRAEIEKWWPIIKGRTSRRTDAAVPTRFRNVRSANQAVHESKKMAHSGGKPRGRYVRSWPELT